MDWIIYWPSKSLIFDDDNFDKIHFSKKISVWIYIMYPSVNEPTESTCEGKTLSKHLQRWLDELSVHHIHSMWTNRMFYCHLYLSATVMEWTLSNKKSLQALFFVRLLIPKWSNSDKTTAASVLNSAAAASCISSSPSSVMFKGSNRCFLLLPRRQKEADWFWNPTTDS